MKKKERQNKDMKEMEKGREGVQKPSQREQLGSKEKLNLPTWRKSLNSREHIFRQIGECSLL